MKRAMRRWRYVICLASFYIHGITWGCISSSGIFEDAFECTYQLSAFKSILPGSIQIASMSVSSIFASILSMKYGIRSTTLVGAFLSILGSILSAVIGEYWAFCLFYGIFLGTGEGLMLVPAVLVIPCYFHSNRVSFATATAVSGASIGMFAIPFLLQYLLNMYGLRGTILLGSCLWLSVALVGILFGQTVTQIEEKRTTTTVDRPISMSREDSVLSQGQSNKLGNQRTSFSPISVYSHQQKHQPSEILSVHTTITTSNSPSSMTLNTTVPHVCTEIYSLLGNNIYRVLIISMSFIWSFDKTNYLFLTDLLKSSNQSEQYSIFLIGITGIADLFGQILFGYLGDKKYVNLFLIWTCTSVLAGISISITPLIASYGIVSLCILFGIHAFFLAAPNALINVIMMDIVGMPRYALAYGFSQFLSGSTSLFGYPILGFLKDHYGNWRIPFVFVSVMMISGGVIIGIIPILICSKKNHSIVR